MLIIGAIVRTYTQGHPLKKLSIKKCFRVVFNVALKCFQDVLGFPAVCSQKCEHTAGCSGICFSLELNFSGYVFFNSSIDTLDIFVVRVILLMPIHGSPVSSRD
jgi:hypothetical protein